MSACIRLTFSVCVFGDSAVDCEVTASGTGGAEVRAQEVFSAAVTTVCRDQITHLCVYVD